MGDKQLVIEQPKLPTLNQVLGRNSGARQSLQRKTEVVELLWSCRRQVGEVLENPLPVGS